MYNTSLPNDKNVGVAVASGHSSNKVRYCSAAALALTLVFLGGWSSDALSATSCTSECDALPDNLQSPEVAVEALSVSPLDLATNELDTSAFDTLQGVALAEDSAAPFLYLAPRIASVLRDIFDASRDEVSQPDLASSPVADAEEWIDISELLDDTIPASKSQTESEDALPLLQRQMFRTDI